MTTTSQTQKEVSDDEYETCLLCGGLTEAHPRAIHVRQEGGANHGLIEAKAYACERCLTDRDGWEYNRVDLR